MRFDHDTAMLDTHTHAEVDRSATAGAMLKLVGFWADLLGE